MSKLSRFMRRIDRDEAGITGLETAIILIAFVIVASVFAFVVLSTGLFSAERGKQTVLAGLEKASGNIEVRGSVSIQDVDPGTGNDGVIDGSAPDVIIFNIANAAGGRPVLIDPDADNNTLVMNLVDSGARVADLTYTVNEILGDTDDLLEAGELFELTVEVPTGMELSVNEEWTLELVPSAGGTLLINRIMPPQIEDLMDLK